MILILICLAGAVAAPDEAAAIEKVIQGAGHEAGGDKAMTSRKGEITGA